MIIWTYPAYVYRFEGKEKLYITGIEGIAALNSRSVAELPKRRHLPRRANDTDGRGKIREFQESVKASRL